MPLDLALSTNTPTATLELADFRVRRVGAVRLEASEGGDVITFSESGGGLHISGDLRDSDADQQLRFAFAAEWEGLEALVDGLRRVWP